MRILISTIIRNREAHVSRWANQLCALTKLNPDIEFDLSVFENDSTDNTKQLLAEHEELLLNHFSSVLVETQDLNWPYFNSIKEEERVSFLARARNFTIDVIEELEGLEQYSKIVCIEPDIDFDPVELSQLLYTTDDIASGYSILPGSSNWIYDCWATRVHQMDEEFAGPSLPDMPDRLDVASTFNCFCVYNAIPFIKGLRFSGTNPLTNRWDCDTTNICLLFRRSGYNKIGLYNIPVVHCS
jgi:hypothetical protein